MKIYLHFLFALFVSCRANGVFKGRGDTLFTNDPRLNRRNDAGPRRLDETYAETDLRQPRRAFLGQDGSLAGEGYNGQPNNLYMTDLDQAYRSRRYQYPTIFSKFGYDSNMSDPPFADATRHKTVSSQDKLQLLDKIKHAEALPPVNWISIDHKHYDEANKNIYGSEPPKDGQSDLNIKNTNLDYNMLASEFENFGDTDVTNVSNNDLTNSVLSDVFNDNNNTKDTQVSSRGADNAEPLFTSVGNIEESTENDYVSPTMQTASKSGGYFGFAGKSLCDTVASCKRPPKKIITVISSCDACKVPESTTPKPIVCGMCVKPRPTPPPPPPPPPPRPPRPCYDCMIPKPKPVCNCQPCCNCGCSRGCNCGCNNGMKNYDDHYFGFGNGLGNSGIGATATSGAYSTAGAGGAFNEGTANTGLNPVGYLSGLGNSGMFPPNPILGPTADLFGK